MAPINRDDARKAADAIRAVLANPSSAGEKTTAHFLLGRPRRGEWWTTWANLPGLTRVRGSYRHSLLPGWEYTEAEMRTEMVDDLEHFAETGEQPKMPSGNPQG
jgi:hypothetical protein